MLPDSGVPDWTERRATTDAVFRALDGLTRRERVVLVLRYYEELTERETAETLGLAVGTVKSTTARALSKLRVSPHLSDHETPVLQEPR